MSEYKKCPICKTWSFTDKHTCPPAYGVRMDDWDKEEEVEVHATSPKEAAKTFLSDRFWDFQCPTSATVIVNDWRADHWAGRLYTYEITVEMAPAFCAELVKEEPVPVEE